jgi:hypothetical protein
MHKYQKNKKYLIKNILKYINSDAKLKNLFNHPKRKYKLDVLLKNIIQILSTGLSFRKHQELLNGKIHWNTVYKFFVKLQKYNIIELSYYDTVKKYNKKFLSKSKTNILITDTTIVPNKLGIDKVGYNPQIPKHKASKISLITDIFGVPLNCNIYSCSNYDSSILNNQLDDIIIHNSELLNNNNILLADAGYDSNVIKNKLKNIKFGKLLSHRNKRNIKDKQKLQAIKLLPTEIKLLKKRIKIEHTNALLKQYRRLSTRYDKYASSYMLFLYLACCDIVLKNINK